MKDYLINTVIKTFEVGPEQAERLYGELMQCMKYKNLITVFRIQDRPEGRIHELDQTILTALFKSQHLSPSEQLHLALTWNRVDIARTEIFVYGQEWPHGESSIPNRILLTNFLSNIFWLSFCSQCFFEAFI